jgi:nucleoside-diphosphate-sugar epimerase
MRIFVAGGSGVIGQRLVPMLVARGHDVVALIRDASKAPRLRAAGAEPVVADALDRAAVRAAVRAARPEVVVHQLTALAHRRSPRAFDRGYAATNLLRTKGTEHLLAAARAVGATRLVAQSFAGWPYARTGGASKREDDALDPSPPRTMRRTLEALRVLEALVLGAPDLEGVVLRYGTLYGPGSSLSAEGELARRVRRRRFPIVGAGSGIWSFVHVDDAAAATVIAIERGPGGIYNVVDDEPAPVASWLPELARALRARPPRHVPVWLARPLLGEAGVSLMLHVRGADNTRAKRELGWVPVHSTWREGFRAALGPARGPSPRVPAGEPSQLAR